MSDPLSDPRAQALQAAVPAEAGDLAAHFSQVAQQAGDAAAGLRGARNDAEWTGQAASAFRAKLGELPGDLDRVQQFNEGLAHALSRYEIELSPVQRSFLNLVPQIQSARSNLAAAQSQLSTAQGQLRSAMAAPKAKPSSPAVTSAHTAVHNATAVTGQTQDEVSGLESQAFRLLDEFDNVRHTAQNGISSAASHAPSPPGFFSSLLHGVEDVMKDVGHIAVAFVKNIGHAFVDIGPALEAALEHPGNLDNWVRVLSDAGSIAGAVAMVVAPFAAPALGGLEVAAEAADVATAVGVGAQAAKGGIELGEGHITAGLTDLASAAAGGMGGGDATELSDSQLNVLGDSAKSLRDGVPATKLGISDSASIDTQLKAFRDDPGTAHLFPPEYDPYAGLGPKAFADKYVKGDGWNWRTDTESGAVPGTTHPDVLAPNQIIDRFGHPGGDFVSDAGVPFPQRALPPDSIVKGYHQYQVLKDIPVTAGQVAGDFGQAGGSIQYVLSNKVQRLLDNGYLRELP